MSWARLAGFKILAARLAIFAALLVITDIIFWLVLPVPNEGVFSQHVRNHELSGLKNRVVYDTIGHRLRAVSAKSIAKKPGTKRILCVGASTTDQMTQNTEDTWCALVERELRAADPDVETHSLSFGRSGDRVVDTARWLRKMVEVIDPDIVITLLGVNDLAWNGGPGYAVRTVEGQRSAGERDVGSRVLTERCAEYSQLCRRVNVAWNAIRTASDLRHGRVVNWDADNIPLLNKTYRELAFAQSVQRQPDPIDEFRSGLSWMLDFLGKRGADVIVLGQPVLWKADLPPEAVDRLWFWVATPNGRVRPSLEWLSLEMQRYNEVQREEAEKRGLAFVDLDAMLPKELEIFFDDCHFTDEGSMRVAKAVTPLVQRLISKSAENVADSSKPGSRVRHHH